MALSATFRHLFHPQRSNNHRPRVLHPEAFVVFGALSLFFAVLVTFVPKVSNKAGEVLGFNSSITATQVVNSTNAERQKLNLQPLKISNSLNEAALAKGQHMLSNQYWSHTAPDGTQPWAFFKQSKYDYSIAGENLARDFSNTDDLLKAWMNSKTHKDNIMNSKYQEIGIAVIDGKLGGVETTLVVQFFGTPMAGTGQLPPLAVSEESRRGAGQADVNLDVLSFVEDTANQGAALPAEALANTASVLSGASMRVSELQTPALFSPLQLTKAFFLAMIFVVVSTLFYDMVIMHHRQTARMVGKNAAHIIFFLLIGFLVVFFRSGVIG